MDIHVKPHSMNAAFLRHQDEQQKNMKLWNVNIQTDDKWQTTGQCWEALPVYDNGFVISNQRNFRLASSSNFLDRCLRIISAQYSVQKTVEKISREGHTQRSQSSSGTKTNSRKTWSYEMWICRQMTNELQHDKTKKWPVRPAKTQISLDISPVTLPCAGVRNDNIHHLQASLIRVFAVRMKKHWALSYLLSGYPGWSESPFGAHVIMLILSCDGSNKATNSHLNIFYNLHFSICIYRYRYLTLVSALRHTRATHNS